MGICQLQVCGRASGHACARTLELHLRQVEPVRSLEDVNQCQQGSRAGRCVLQDPLRRGGGLLAGAKILQQGGDIRDQLDIQMIEILPSIERAPRFFESPILDAAGRIPATHLGIIGRQGVSAPQRSLAARVVAALDEGHGEIDEKSSAAGTLFRRFQVGGNGRARAIQRPIRGRTLQPLGVTQKL